MVGENDILLDLEEFSYDLKNNVITMSMTYLLC